MSSSDKSVDAKNSQENAKKDNDGPLPIAPTETTEKLVSRIFICCALVLGMSFFVKLPWYSKVLFVFLPCYLPGFMGKDEFRSGRIWPWFRNLSIWQLFVWYFSASYRLKQKGDIDPQQQYIFCSHPHGISSAHHLLFLTNALDFDSISPHDRRRHLCASILFKFPLIRDFFLWIGGVDASRPVASRLAAMGYSLFILVGGEQEQMRCVQHQEQAFVSTRRGHIRLALEFGIPLVPMYCFGENDLFSVFTPFLDVRLWIVKQYRVALAFGWGAWWCPFIPKRIPLTLCVGRPILVEQVENPTAAQIDELQKQYIEGLLQVFNENKAELGYSDKELRIL